MRHFYIAPFGERWAYAIREARDRQFFEAGSFVLGGLAGLFKPIQAMGPIWSIVLFSGAAWLAIMATRIVYLLWQAPVVLAEAQFRELERSYEAATAQLEASRHAPLSLDVIRLMDKALATAANAQDGQRAIVEELSRYSRENGTLRTERDTLVVQLAMGDRYGDAFAQAFQTMVGLASRSMDRVDRLYEFGKRALDREEILIAVVEKIREALAAWSNSPRDNDLVMMRIALILIRHYENPTEMPEMPLVQHAGDPPLPGKPFILRPSASNEGTPSTEPG